MTTPCTYWGTPLTPTESQAVAFPQKSKLFIISEHSLELALHSLLQFASVYPASRVLLFLEDASLSEVRSLLKQYGLAYAQEHRVDSLQHSPSLCLRYENGSELWCRTSAGQLEYLRGFEFDFIVLYEAQKFVDTTRPEIVTTLLGLLLGHNSVTGQMRAQQFWLFAHACKNDYLARRWEKGDPTSPEYMPNQFLSIREHNPFR